MCSRCFLIVSGPDAQRRRGLRVAAAARNHMGGGHATSRLCIPPLERGDPLRVSKGLDHMGTEAIQSVHVHRTNSPPRRDSRIRPAAPSEIVRLLKGPRL
jgi:hypothetical protein